MFQRCRFVSSTRFRSAFDDPRIIEKILKKYSRMKLQMKREALAKLNRQANETGQGFGTVKG